MMPEWFKRVLAQAVGKFPPPSSPASRYEQREAMSQWLQEEILDLRVPEDFVDALQTAWQRNRNARIVGGYPSFVRRLLKVQGDGGEETRFGVRWGVTQYGHDGWIVVRVDGGYGHDSPEISIGSHDTVRAKLESPEDVRGLSAKLRELADLLDAKLAESLEGE